MLLFGFFYGMTAIHPDILKDPKIFCNYIIFIIFNVYIQETEKRDFNRELKHTIDNLQKQIDKLKQMNNNQE